MAVQLIDNRYIKLEDLRSLLQTKFGSGKFSILERDQDYEITVPRELIKSEIDSISRGG